jgi:hypothetical protein
MHPNGRILTDDLEFIWQQTHHTVIQCHIGNVLQALDLEICGGWGIVREELAKVVSCMDSNEGRNKLFKYMTNEYMDSKCFLEMRTKDTRSVSELASQPADILGNYEKKSQIVFWDSTFGCRNWNNVILFFIRQLEYSIDDGSKAVAREDTVVGDPQ